MNELLEILSPILGAELATAIILHRKAIRKPLTPYAAQLQVKEYVKTGDPVAAAEMQLLHGWQAIKADWYHNQVAKDRKTAQAVAPAFNYASRDEYLAAERRRVERSFGEETNVVQIDPAKRAEMADRARVLMKVGVGA